jgi:hypothetical protein
MGVPVAILVPAGKRGKKDTREVVAQLKAFARGRKLPEGITVRSLIAEGRRGVSAILAVDASVAMSWCFPDEADRYAYAVLDALPDSTAMAPSLWPVELANALAMGERRKRITRSDTTRFLILIAALPIDIDSETSARAG